EVTVPEPTIMGPPAFTVMQSDVQLERWAESSSQAASASAASETAIHRGMRSAPMAGLLRPVPEPLVVDREAVAAEERARGPVERPDVERDQLDLALSRGGAHRVEQ